MNSGFSKKQRSVPKLSLAAFMLVPLLLTSQAAKAETRSEASSMVSQGLFSKPAAEPLLFREYASISISSLQPSPFVQKPIISPLAKLQGYVSFTDHVPDPGQVIQNLVNVAVARDKERDLLLQRAKFHNKVWTRVLGRSKGMLQYATSYQGFESSSEGADVILEEKLKLKSASAVEFVRQRRMDAAHLQLTCAVMELATGLGMSDEAKGQQAIRAGIQEMIPLVGEEEASRSLELLKTWSKQVKVPDEGFTRDPWDVLAMRQKSREMLASSLRDDDVVKSIETRLHKFNHHSNFARATSKFVNTTLSLVAFSPTMASPAAQAAQFVYVACTGGPEEKKLLKEVYLDRCFESRFERLSQESMMSINNYNCAVLTHNPVLFACTQAVIDNLTNPEVGAALTSATATMPQQLSSHKAFGERI
jgi:hypothetical protein